MIMKNIKLNLIISSLLILIVCSCKHTNFNTEKQVGPGICVPDDFSINNFTVLSSTTGLDSVNFTGSSNTEKVKIHADLSSDVSWGVIIRGNSTNAVKRFNGKSKTIDIEWNGIADSLKLFSNEYCTVSLEFQCFASPTKMFKIIKPTNFMNVGLLVSDYDGNGAFGSRFLTWSDGCMMTYGPASGGSIASKKIQLPSTVSSTNGVIASSPQGGNVFYMNCTSAAAGYYIAGVQTAIAGLGGYVLPTNQTTNLSESARPLTIKKVFGSNVATSDLYVNIFINVNSNDQANLSMYLKEWKMLKSKISGQDSLYVSSDSYISNIAPSPNKDWQYYSIKMSDFKLDGKSIQDPTKITFLGLDYQSKDAGPKKVEAALDLIIITKGEPLFPKLVKK
ncbi:MAG: hypothetical protein RLZZ175_2078 [Bacteroidota bacterium]|jgi:hypothetical protein